MKKIVAGLVLAGGIAGLTGCAPSAYPQSEYCVDNYGDVVSPSYCAYGYSGPHNYSLFLGSGHYHVGSVIPHTMIVHHTINPYSAKARARVGLSKTSVIHTGSSISTPAKPQTSITRTKTSGGFFNKVRSRVSTGFKSSFRSTTRSGYHR